MMHSALTIMHSVFSVMAGVVVEMLFMFITLCNGLKTSEYEVYWLTDFPPINLLGAHQEIIMVFSEKKADKQEKLVILQSVTKSKETRVITYTCRYSSGYLIPS